MTDIVSQTHIANCKLKVKAIANKWMSENLKRERRYLTTSNWKYNDMVWTSSLFAKHFNNKIVGSLKIDVSLRVVEHTKPHVITNRLKRILQSDNLKQTTRRSEGGLQFGNGIKGAEAMSDRSIDLLLTDPPYGISTPYTCERQIPRRIRKNGSDFIMPKGEFGNWDYGFNPREWTDAVIPKVKGWAVIFCAHAQIGEYLNILTTHGFNSVGTFVWHKTNPVPFNHKFKPLNAWEAIVVGKRPGTKFNGKSVHNVFTCKSPSPQERIHPTQKPLELIERFIELFSAEKNIVLDPFAGSGTTVIGSAHMKRNVIAYENNLGYYNKAIERILADKKTK